MRWATEEDVDRALDAFREVARKYPFKVVLPKSPPASAPLPQPPGPKVIIIDSLSLLK